jgi:manganese/zinc/iron transport system ATP- binding protein
MTVPVMDPHGQDGRPAVPGLPAEDDRLILRHVTVAYGPKVVLDDIGTEVRRGQVVGVIGPNGGGKSTLLQAILGLVPLVRGTITLFGRPSAAQRPRIAYVPQREAVDWEFPVTVREVVLMGRYVHTGWLRRPGRQDLAVVDRVLDRMGMRAQATTQIGQLSGGQQQRVFLARALAQEADVLLLDEPLTGIDATTHEVILAVIEEQRTQGKIVVLATHDLVSASCACDCFCCLNQRLVSFGPVQDTYTAENLSATYGGPVILLGAPGAAGRPASHHEADHLHPPPPPWPRGSVR